MKDKTLIMIVDDDPNIAQLVKLYLEKDGYDTVVGNMLRKRGNLFH